MTRSATARKTDALVANTVALVLGTAAFSVSFTHVVSVAAEHGQTGWVSKAIATSVELMALASVAELRRRKSRGEPVWIAVAVLLLGVAMSLASNLATAAPGAWGKLMAAWPAVAFLAVASLVESRAGGRDEDEAQPSRAAGADRTGQAADIRTESARRAALDPYVAGTDSVRMQDAARMESIRMQDAARTQDARTEPVRTAEVRTEPVRTELPQQGGGDEAAGSRTDAVAAPADQSAAAAALIANAKQDVDEPQEVAPVQDAPVAPVTSSPAVPATVLPTMVLNGRDSRDNAPDSVLVAPFDGPAAPAPAARAAEAAPASGWLPGASGLLLPAALAAGARKPSLIVPGRPAPVPGPRPAAPASARTDRPRPARTAVRTEQSAKSRTGDAVRTDKTRTDRPARTDVVAELVREIRTDAAWRPDYEALMARTGYQRSFLEKCVRDARKRVGVAA